MWGVWGWVRVSVRKLVWVYQAFWPRGRATTMMFWCKIRKHHSYHEPTTEELLHYLPLHPDPPPPPHTLTFLWWSSVKVDTHFHEVRSYIFDLWPHWHSQNLHKCGIVWEVSQTDRQTNRPKDEENELCMFVNRQSDRHTTKVTNRLFWVSGFYGTTSNLRSRHFKARLTCEFMQTHDSEMCTVTTLLMKCCALCQPPLM